MACGSACLPLLPFAGTARAQRTKVRQPAVAGAFYPAGADELTKTIDGFLARAAPRAQGEVVALVAPHAGYPYAGPVAAYAYALLKGRHFARVVVIAPSHYESFDYTSVYDGDAYSTPLGLVKVDKVFAKKLAGMSPSMRLSGAGHTPSRDRPEHSLEVQLPWLQRVLGEFELVPVIMGDQDYDHCRALGVAIAKLAAGGNTLIVASSDLSHYHPYEQAVKLDHKTLAAVAEYDYFDMARNFESRVWEACGGGPVVAAMIAAERLGATRAEVLQYLNSGDTSGDKSRVVGYGAVAITKTAARTASDAFSLSRGEQDELLRIARQSVESAVRDRKPYAGDAAGLEALARERGAFVTLKERGELRGCIGYVAPAKPLYATVRDAAMMAALRDTRFSPVSAGELARLEYEISVLSPLRRVLDVREIRVGVDGLLIHKGGVEGLLLPQVAAEEHWDRAQLLEGVSMKAGLSKTAWQDPAADLFRFTAFVFGERRPGAPAKP
jgi:hypothetical protein